MLVLFLSAVVALGALAAPERIGDRIAPRATIVADPAPGERTPEQIAFLRGLAPHLEVLVGEGNALATLASERSRDILELTVRMERYRAAANDIDQYIRDHPTPPGLEQFVTELQQRIGDSLVAIDAAVAAFRRFDWEALGESVRSFSGAVDEITLLAGTPTPGIS